MTKDDVIRFYEQAFVEVNDENGVLCKTFSKFIFANLVAEHEREACAKICEAGINNATDWDSSAWDQACENRSYAIRARGRT